MSTDSRVQFFSYSFSPPAFSCLSGLWAAAAPFSDLHVGTFLTPAVRCPGLCTHVNIYVSSCSLSSCCNPSGSFSGDTVLPVAAWESFPYLPTWSPVRVSPAPVTCFYALLSHPPHGQCSTPLWVSLWTLSDSISLALSCSDPACCQAACFPLSSLRAYRSYILQEDVLLYVFLPPWTRASIQNSGQKLVYLISKFSQIIVRYATAQVNDPKVPYCQGVWVKASLQSLASIYLRSLECLG